METIHLLSKNSKLISLQPYYCFREITCCHLESTADTTETCGESLKWKSVFLFFFLMDNQKGNLVFVQMQVPNYVHV